MVGHSRLKVQGKSGEFTGPKFGKNFGGFTIVEMLLATAVFSVVILVAVAGFLGIGRLFYKGVTLTQNQATARHILDLVTSDIQSASTPVQTHVIASDPNRKYICIGSARYIFNIYKPVILPDDVNNQKFGLLRDNLPGNSSCINPFQNDGGGIAPPNNPTELLGNGMRLNDFKITALGSSSVYTASINLATGDDDPSTPQATCNSSTSNSQYCAQTELSVTASEGL